MLGASLQLQLLSVSALLLLLLCIPFLRISFFAWKCCFRYVQTYIYKKSTQHTSHTSKSGIQIIQPTPWAWAPRDERIHIRACTNSANTAHAHVHHGMWRHMDEHGLRI